MSRAWAWWKQKVDGWADQAATLPKPLALYRASLRDYRDNWRELVWMLAIVAVPVAVVSALWVDPTGDSRLSAYLAITQLIMNAAALFAAGKIVSGQPFSAASAYYEGSGLLVRLVLTSVALVVMLLPLLLGLLILFEGLIVPDAALGGVERSLLVILALIVSVPSIILLTRGLWAIFVLFDTSLGPIGALRASRALTKKRVVIVLGRLLALAVFLIATILLPAAVLGGLQLVTKWAGFQVILQIVLTLIVLPLSNLYLYRFYRALQK